MKILITGANGFVGKNLQVNLKQRAGTELLLFDLPQTIEDLRALVRQADFVFHLAGVNRPEDAEEFHSGNAVLTKSLVEMLEEENRAVPLVLSSSTQARLDNPYGLSKKEAEEVVFSYAKKTGAPVYVYRFPNVFGKWCRPNYNSVVATFCHNAANQIPLRIDDASKELTLLYIDDICTEFQKILDGEVPHSADSFVEAAPAYAISLGALANMITGFAESRQTLNLEYSLSDALTKKLFATFMSYAPKNALAVTADMKRDGRGYFAELIRSPDFGQISISRTKPGVTRGNHWHSTKLEKFVVVEGDAVIRLRKIGSDEVIEYSVSGNEIKIVDMPPGYAHSIENVGSIDVLTIFWAGEIFNPENPDTIFETV